jgi:hypothetical protein
MRTVGVITMLALAVWGAVPVGAAQGITLCEDLFPNSLRQANWSVLLSYELETNATGDVSRVTKRHKFAFSDGPLIACLRRWKLPSHNAKVNVMLKWDHGAGWTQIHIVLPGEGTRVIRITPGWPF